MDSFRPGVSINDMNLSDNDTPKSVDNNLDYKIDIPIETENNYDIENDMNSKIDKALKEKGENEKSKQNSDTNSIEQHLNDVIKKLRERVIIYEYLCNRTNGFYSILNKCFLIPSIFLSSGLTLFNSNYFKNSEDNSVVLSNVIGNSILTLLIALQNAFKFGEKSDYFFNMKKKFSKLHNTLNNEIINQISYLKINQNKLLDFMTEYDHLDQSIHYDIPRHIIVDTRNKFKHYSLPTICNGVEVVEEDVQPRDPKKHVFTGILRSNKKKSYQINL